MTVLRQAEEGQKDRRSRTQKQCSGVTLRHLSGCHQPHTSTCRLADYCKCTARSPSSPRCHLAISTFAYFFPRHIQHIHLACNSLSDRTWFKAHPFFPSSPNLFLRSRPPHLLSYHNPLQKLFLPPSLFPQYTPSLPIYRIYLVLHHGGSFHTHGQPLGVRFCGNYQRRRWR